MVLIEFPFFTATMTENVSLKLGERREKRWKMEKEREKGCRFSKFKPKDN